MNRVNEKEINKLQEIRERREVSEGGSCFGWHVFLAQIDGRTYRCSSVLSDTEFEHLMDMMQWKMPYHLRAFHTSDPKWAVENPVLREAPELSVDIDSLLATYPPQAMRLKDKRRQQTFSVRRKYGDYVLADTEDGY